MHIAIDDTYGPEGDTKSSFVTGNRRTHVAVLFQDNDVHNIRTQMNECLDEIRNLIGVNLQEFHFVDIYNRKGPWKGISDNTNLKIFEFFAFIYKHYRWPVFIQTVDDRTLLDHGIKKINAEFDGLDLSNETDLSLFWLLCKIKFSFKQKPTSISLFLDEGREKPGKPFAERIFKYWQIPYCGRYASSSAEPLLQLADFIAFCINRCTHLSMKEQRTDLDNWFLMLIAKMQINCDDLLLAALPKDFTVQDFDKVHRYDRNEKGL